MIDPAEASSEDLDQPIDDLPQERVSLDASDPGTDKQMGPVQITRLAFIVETVLVVIALAAAIWFDFYDRDRPMTAWFTGHWIGSLAIGSLLALPLFVLIIVILPSIPPLRDVFESIEDSVAPLFKGMKLWQAAVISLLAGMGEEIFFRWCLQGGLAQSMPMVTAIIIASVIFGACHWLNTTYFVLTTIIGVILALIYLNAGPLAAIACHAVYDFFAIRYLIRKNPDHQSYSD